MASSTWARRGGSPRYPVQLSVMTDQRMADDIEAFVDATNSSTSEVCREAIAAGLPILRKRAARDGLLPQSEAVA